MLAETARPLFSATADRHGFRGIFIWDFFPVFCQFFLMRSVAWCVESIVWLLYRGALMNQDIVNCLLGPVIWSKNAH